MINFQSVLNGLWLNIQQEINQAPHWGGPVTEDQLKTLNSLMNDAMYTTGKIKRQVRLEILRTMCHRAELNSTLELSKWEASEVITFIKEPNTWEIDKDARQLIEYLERQARITVDTRTNEEGVTQEEISWTPAEGSLPDL